MKLTKKLRCLLLFSMIIVTAIALQNTTSFAAEVQYSDNVIPVMTSDTAPSGKANASSVNSSFSAFYAFNHQSGTDAWVANSTSAWLEYDFPNAKCITMYAITSRAAYNPTSMPKTWTFEAWDSNQNSWIVLDTRTYTEAWSTGERKVFTFINTKYYNNYRINVTSAVDSNMYIVIGELEMMETVDSVPSTPSNLVASTEDKRVNLSWSAVAGATNYNIKRADTLGGPYTTLSSVSGSESSYIDTNVDYGKTYFYVVSAVVSGVESPDSNEVSATISAAYTNAILEITMTNGNIKEYDLTYAEIEAFLTWYENRSDGIGKSYFKIIKKNNIKPFLNRKEYISFNNISSFEIKEYNQ